MPIPWLYPSRNQCRNRRGAKTAPPLSLPGPNRPRPWVFPQRLASGRQNLVPLLRVNFRDAPPGEPGVGLDAEQEGPVKITVIFDP